MIYSQKTSFFPRLNKMSHENKMGGFSPPKSYLFLCVEVCKGPHARRQYLKKIYLKRSMNVMQKEFQEI